MEKDLCATIFRGYSEGEPKDFTGCLKEYGHHDHHVFRSTEGVLIAWEYDAECKCGCWDTVEEDNEQCMTYWEVKSID